MKAPSHSAIDCSVTDMHRDRNTRTVCAPRPPSLQRGATLFVALVLMIVLALLGIVGMKVAGMQERMSADYRDINLAFQATEMGARESEQQIQAKVQDYSMDATATGCDTTFDPVAWADSAKIPADKQYVDTVSAIGKCFPFGSIGVGDSPNKDPSAIYQVTVLGKSSNGASTAVVDTVYIP